MRVCMCGHVRVCSRNQEGLPYCGVDGFVVIMGAELPPCSCVYVYVYIIDASGCDLPTLLSV